MMFQGWRQGREGPDERAALVRTSSSRRCKKPAHLAYELRCGGKCQHLMQRVNGDDLDDTIS